MPSPKQWGWLRKENSFLLPSTNVLWPTGNHWHPRGKKLEKHRAYAVAAQLDKLKKAVRDLKQNNPDAGGDFSKHMMDVTFGLLSAKQELLLSVPDGEHEVPTVTEHNQEGKEE
jgi:hypothetical protein